MPRPETRHASIWMGAKPKHLAKELVNGTKLFWLPVPIVKLDVEYKVGFLTERNRGFLVSADVFRMARGCPEHFGPFPDELFHLFEELPPGANVFKVLPPESD